MAKAVTKNRFNIYNNVTPIIKTGLPQNGSLFFIADSLFPRVELSVRSLISHIEVPLHKITSLISDAIDKRFPVHLNSYPKMNLLSITKWQLTPSFQTDDGHAHNVQTATLICCR